jgi:hypothetical protein
LHGYTPPEARKSFHALCGPARDAAGPIAVVAGPIAVVAGPIAVVAGPIAVAAGPIGKLTVRRFWNYARAQSTGRRRDGGALTDVELPASRLDPEESTYGEELRRRVHQILAQMPENLAQVIRLVDLDGTSHEEVAAGLGCTLNALRVLLHRARSAFHEIAEIDLGEELKGVR